MKLLGLSLLAGAQALSITRYELQSGIDSIDGLLQYTGFPNKYSSSLESSQGFASFDGISNFGEMIETVFNAKVEGNYEFMITCSGQCYLYLQNSVTTSDKYLHSNSSSIVARVPQGSTQGVYSDLPSQRSGKIFLKANSAVTMETLQLHAYGTHFLSVAVLLPSGQLIAPVSAALQLPSGTHTTKGTVGGTVGVTSSAITVNTATIHWSPSLSSLSTPRKESDPLSCDLRYEVYLVKGKGHKYLIASTTLQDVKLTRLEANTVYTVFVRTLVDTNLGTYSLVDGSYTFKTLTDDSLVVSKFTLQPTSFAVSVVDSRSLVLQWIPSQYAPAESSTIYELWQYAPDQKLIFSSPSTIFMYNKLTVGGEYQFGLRAKITSAGGSTYESDFIFKSVHLPEALSGNAFDISFNYDTEALSEETTVGGFLRQVWTEVSGNLNALRADPRFPNSPSLSEVFNDVPLGLDDIGDFYGQLIRAYYLPPVSGYYVFEISANNEAELSLSSDESRINSRIIATCYELVDREVYDRFPSQRSIPIQLNAGQKYYLEVLHKEQSGDGFVSVRVTHPDGFIDEPIAPEHLEPYSLTFYDQAMLSSRDARVEDLKMDDTGAQEATLSWSIPVVSSLHNLDVNFDIIIAEFDSPIGHPTDWKLIGSVSGTSTTIKSLTVSTAYVVRVRAVYALSTGGSKSYSDWSEISFMTTGLNGVTVPAATTTAPPVSETTFPVSLAFKVQLVYVDVPTNLDPRIIAAFDKASVKWASLFTGGQTNIQQNTARTICGVSLFKGQIVDDLLIGISLKKIDGPFGVLGQAGPCAIRTSDRTPWIGTMMFDIADLDYMLKLGTLETVVIHEMGHVFGIGTLWGDQGTIKGAGTVNPVYTGTQGVAEYGSIGGPAGLSVPVENRGGDGTRDAHWSELIFGDELMTGFLSGQTQPMSRLTVAALADLGYKVDINKADTFFLQPKRHLRADEEHRHLESLFSYGNDIVTGSQFLTTEQGVVVKIINSPTYLTDASDTEDEINLPRKEAPPLVGKERQEAVTPNLSSGATTMPMREVCVALIVTLFSFRYFATHFV